MLRVVDLFAGWGGFSVGAEQAGAEVVWAANHWPLAVEAHAQNHPRTTHVCQDLRQADWTKLPEYDVLLAAPACQGHSTASQPKRRAYHDPRRATAFAVVAAADITEPAAIVVENVPAFRRWRQYKHWCAMLREIGYTLSEHRVRASHYGVPQRRDRLFVVGVLDDERKVRLPSTGEEPAFGPCVEWNAPGWRRVRSATLKVRERIDKGRRNHGRTFLTQHVTGHPGVSLDEPIRTITTQDQWALVDGDHYRPLTLRENARGMSFPDHYTWPKTAKRRETITGIGNAVPPKVGEMMVSTIARHIGAPLRAGRLITPDLETP